jgi:hypothetical protein
MATLTTKPNIEDNTCNISIPDYNVLRQDNLNKINNYYNNLMSSYSKDNENYLSQVESTNINDRTFAITKLRPKLTEYNDHIIKVNKNLINKVDTEIDLIKEQKKTLNEKVAIIDNLREEVKNMKTKDKEISNVANSNNDTITQTKNEIKYLEIYNNIYIGANVILLIISIYLMVQ